MNTQNATLPLHRPIEINELSAWLAIRRCPGIGPRRFAALLQQEKSLLNCFSDGRPRHDFITWCQHHGITQFEPDWKGVEKDLAWAQMPDCTILTWEDERYPPSLKEIASSPPLLFVKGKLEALHRQQIALVGSRHPTASGQENAYRFAYELVRFCFAITSGLALGIDAASHEGALAAEGITLAVLGNSLDQVYPVKHQNLAQAITVNGALVSEFPIGTPPKAEHFPQRNRIISGLSLGVVVVESALNSGSLITANYALEQGREVFAIPGSIHNPVAKGCNQLIRQGAKCVESVEHILEEFSVVALKRAPIHQREETPLRHSKNRVKAPVAPNRLLALPEIANQQDMQLLAHVGQDNTPIDVIVQRSGLTVDVVSSMLLILELHGLVAAVPGGYIRIATDGDAL